MLCYARYHSRSEWILECRPDYLAQVRFQTLCQAATELRLERGIEDRSQAPVFRWSGRDSTFRAGVEVDRGIVETGLRVR